MDELVAYGEQPWYARLARLVAGLSGEERAYAAGHAAYVVGARPAVAVRPAWIEPVRAGLLRIAVERALRGEVRA